eukprot:scaffold131539_cov33-Tisochrysis_lutea.AAC.6
MEELAAAATEAYEEARAGRMRLSAREKAALTRSNSGASRWLAWAETAASVADTDGVVSSAGAGGVSSGSSPHGRRSLLSCGGSDSFGVRSTSHLVSAGRTSRAAL